LSAVYAANPFMFLRVVSTALFRMAGRSSMPAPPFFASQLYSLNIKVTLQIKRHKGARQKL
jgi:hypothetical protein